MAESLTPESAGALPPTPPDPSWEVLALTAVAASVFMALGEKRRREMLSMLEDIEQDWRRAAPGALNTAAEWVVRPLAEYLRTQLVPR